tara:strand:- start:5784 stop:6890 length:1107 start_codon:yes stop_codon:yes gene_type:complete
MTNQAKEMYALSIQQTANLIHSVPNRTVIAQGHMGSAKTSGIAAELAELRPDNIYVEFDCTNKDIQDLSGPKFMKAAEGMISDYIQFVPNAELGAHLGKPITLNFDELFKAPEPVKKGVRRIMLERKVGNLELPDGSLIYGTSNLGAEGLGDVLQAHQRNAMIIVNTRKPTMMEYLEYGINNGFNHIFLGWCKDNPQLMHTFLEVKDPEENPYIFHPKAVGRNAFFTCRTGEFASDILNSSEHMDDVTTQAALMGAIGERGAMDLMAHVKLANQLPSLQSIKDDPKGAKIPDNAAAKCMVVYRTLSTLDKDWINAWMDYLPRLDGITQGLFVNGVRAPKYSKQSMVMTNKKFTDWAMQNSSLYSADKV